MTSRKRSSSINLARMRKSFAIKPLAVGIASIFLAACGEERQDGIIYTSLDECLNDNPESAAEACRSAYQDALDEAIRTGPKFGSEYDCEYEFGPNQCRSVETGSGSFFMPFMAGYMVGNLLSPSRYYYQPLYTSYSRHSPFRSRWVMSDGYVFKGDIRDRRYRVRESTFTKKPAVNRTIKRGGFGSSVRAKSNWSSSSRKSGWGG
jgi:uncharacterized protein YgiB involved in biofilm formation